MWLVESPYRFFEVVETKRLFGKSFGVLLATLKKRFLVDVTIFTSQEAQFREVGRSDDGCDLANRFKSVLGPCFQTAPALTWEFPGQRRVPYLESVAFIRALSHRLQIRSSDWCSRNDNSSWHALRASFHSSDDSRDSSKSDRIN